MNAPADIFVLTECPACGGSGGTKDRGAKCPKCRGSGTVKRRVEPVTVDLAADRDAAFALAAKRDADRVDGLRRQVIRLKKGGVHRSKWPADVLAFQRAREKKKSRNRSCLSIRRDIYEAFQRSIDGSVSAGVERLILAELGEDAL